MVTESEKPKTVITSDERGLSTWLVWAILLLAGLIGWALSSYQLQKDSGSLSRTINVASRLQSTASAVNAEAVLAAFGNAGSLDRLNQKKQLLQSDLSLLRAGGLADPNDRYPVLALGGRPDIPLAAVATDMQTFSGAVQPMMGAYDALNEAAEAETGLLKVIARIRQLSSNINASSSLTTGSWGAALQPIRTDLTRRELDSMNAVFTPSEGGKSLARQWSDIFVQRAKDAKALADVAPRDSSLSPSEKQLVSDLAKESATLARYAKTLLDTTDIRIQVRASLDPIRASSQSLQDSSDKVVKSISALSQKRGVMDYVWWASLILSLIGFLGVLRSLWAMGYGRWRAQQDGLKGTQIYASVERLTRELRRIINLETNNDRVSQPSESPVFPLLSLVNQVLSSRSDASSLVENRSRELQKTMFELDGMSAQAINQTVMSKSFLDHLADNTNKQALQIATVCEELDLGLEQLSDVTKISFKGGGLAQESSWKMGSLRENTQSMAKRIKRLGEGAQSIHVSSDMIKDVTRRVKVLALNLAVQAAGHGEQGKVFASLAGELERLAQNTEQAVKDIEAQIQTIQSDAKETVASMENGIADVVEIAHLSTESINTFKEQDRNLEKIKQTLDDVLVKMQQSAIVLSSETESAKEAGSKVENLEEDLRSIHARTAEIKNVLKSFGAWLSTVGRDF